MEERTIKKRLNFRHAQLGTLLQIKSGSPLTFCQDNIHTYLSHNMKENKPFTIINIQRTMLLYKFIFVVSSAYTKFWLAINC